MGQTVALQEFCGGRSPRGCLEPAPAVPACVLEPLGWPGANLGRTEGESRDPLRLAERDTVGRGLWFLPATAY